MYVCEQCGKVTQSGQEALVKTVKTREKEYTEMRGTDTPRPYEVVVGEGHETVKEIRVCRTCFGIEELPEPTTVKGTDHNPPAEPDGTLTLSLANGRSITSNSGYDLVCFYETNGEGLTAKPKSKKRKKKKKKKSKD